MPILKDRNTAPLLSQRKHGLVFATAGDVAYKLRCLLLEFEKHFQTKINPEALIVDRYTGPGGLLIPAILAGNVPDDYTPQFQGIALTVLSSAKTIPTVGMAQYVSGQQFTVDVKDRSGNNLISSIIPFIRRNLFDDSLFVPRNDLEENDARVPNGLLFINLYDDDNRSRRLEFIDLDGYQ